MNIIKMGLTGLMFLSCVSFGFAAGHEGGVGGGAHGNFTPTTGNVPPGLSNKGLPPGLNSPPHGWSRGKAYWKNTGTNVRGHHIHHRGNFHSTTYHPIETRS